MSTERIILGIDPGTNNMGIGVICIKGSQVEILAMDVLKLNKLSNHALKLKKIFETTLCIIDAYNPDELAIESQFFGKNVQSMLKLGRAQGVAIAAALYRNVPIFEYSPRKIKQSVTGNGNASKEQLAAMIMQVLSIKQTPDYLDITDALGVALCHYYQKKKLSGSAESSYTDWKAFISDNPGRVKK
ncbi:MAG: crossover junction endodeoxyribonuclease RuvC [Bacteroidota bacterium]